MAKFHIGKNGPAICRASKKACPLGGENHFGSMGEAISAYEEKLATKHGDFPKLHEASSILKEIEKFQKEEEIANRAFEAIKQGKPLIYCWSIASELSDFSAITYENYFDDLSEKEGIEELERNLNDHFARNSDDWMEAKDLIEYSF